MLRSALPPWICICKRRYKFWSSSNNAVYRRAFSCNCDSMDDIVKLRSFSRLCESKRDSIKALFSSSNSVICCLRSEITVSGINSFACDSTGACALSVIIWAELVLEVVFTIPKRDPNPNNPSAVESEVGAEWLPDPLVNRTDGSWCCASFFCCVKFSICLVENSNDCCNSKLCFSRSSIFNFNFWISFAEAWLASVCPSTGLNTWNTELLRELEKSSFAGLSIKLLETVDFACWFVSDSVWTRRSSRSTATGTCRSCLRLFTSSLWTDRAPSSSWTLCTNEEFSSSNSFISLSAHSSASSNCAVMRLAFVAWLPEASDNKRTSAWSSAFWSIKVSTSVCLNKSSSGSVFSSFLFLLKKIDWTEVTLFFEDCFFLSSAKSFRTDSLSIELPKAAVFG